MEELNQSKNPWKANNGAFFAQASISMIRVIIQNIIKIIDFYLKERNYDFVLTNKFNQDC